MHASINKPQSCVENKLLGKCRASARGCDSWVLECKRAWRMAHSAVNSVATEEGRRKTGSFKRIVGT